MHKSLNFLLDEYCESLQLTRKLTDRARKRGDAGKNDVSQLTGMENSLQWAIEYMVTGYMPICSEGPYTKQVPTDPQKVLSLFANDVIRQRCNEEKIEAVLNILDKLSDKEKNAIMLVWGEGFSYRDAGRMMKIPHTTVWDAVKRATQKLGNIGVENYRVKGV